MGFTFKFSAIDIKSRKEVSGDLAYVEQSNGTIKPMIVKRRAHGGNLYITSRYTIDPLTINLITNYESD